MSARYRCTEDATSVPLKAQCWARNRITINSHDQQGKWLFVRQKYPLFSVRRNIKIYSRFTSNPQFKG